VVLVGAVGIEPTTFGSKGPARQTTFQCGRQANWAQPFLKFVASFCLRRNNEGQWWDVIGIRSPSLFCDNANEIDVLNVPITICLPLEQTKTC
jgi:hypothetical protein